MQNHGLGTHNDKKCLLRLHPKVPKSAPNLFVPSAQSVKTFGMFWKKLLSRVRSPSYSITPIEKNRMDRFSTSHLSSYVKSSLDNNNITTVTSLTYNSKVGWSIWVIAYKRAHNIVIKMWLRAQILCPNVSTTPLPQWGFRQCLPLSFR